QVDGAEAALADLAQDLVLPERLFADERIDLFATQREVAVRLLRDRRRGALESRRRAIFHPPTVRQRPRPGQTALRAALFGAVVLEDHLGVLALLDGHFLGLGAVLLVPGLERVFARR